MPKRGGKRGGGHHGHRKKASSPNQPIQVENESNVDNAENEDNLEDIASLSFTRNAVVSTSSLEEEKVLSWSESFQPESAYVNCRNEDSLLLIFSYLSLLDALQMGSTCRRMYHLYRTSCHSRKSLVLIRGSQSFALDLKSSFFLGDGVQQQVSEKNSISQLALNQICLPKFEPSFNQILPFNSQFFASTLPNLSYLEITTGLLQENLSDLIRALNSLTLLETLKLFLNCCQEFDKTLDHMLNFINGSQDFVMSVPTKDEKRQQILKRLSLDPGVYTHLPVYTLRLPVLKHLTMAIRVGNLFHERLYLANGIKQTSGRKLYEVKTAPNFFSLNCPQLSAFYLSSLDSLKDICCLIRKHVMPSSRLVAGSSDVQINLTLSESDDKVLPNVSELNEVKEPLTYITRMEIGNKRMPPSITNLLLLLMNLREICFTVNFATTTSTSYYSTMLTALSKLSNLKSLKINVDDDQKTPLAASLTALPTVTKLTIKYATSNHIDVVDQLKLVHCFPGLTNFSCSFNQSYCDLCLYGLASFASLLESRGLVTSYSPGDEEEEAYCRGTKVPTKLAKKLLRCGKVLVNQFDKLKTVKPEDRQIFFFFKGKNTNLCYSPLDNEFIVD